MVRLRPGWGVRLEAAARLLGTHDPVASMEAEWPAGRVRVSAFLGVVDLPTEIPGRVRCLVSDGEQVLVTWNPDDIPDCFPGGGAQPGESIAETAYREVWEETGWHIDRHSIEPLGWIHIESLFDPDPDLPFPNPDSFMTVVRAAPSHPDDGHEGWADRDGYITRSAFVPLEDLPSRVVGDPVSAVYLDAAFTRRWRTRARRGN